MLGLSKLRTFIDTKCAVVTIFLTSIFIMPAASQQPVVVKNIPYSGNYLPSNIDCKQMSDIAMDAVLHVASKGISGFESSCQTKKIVKQGNIFTLNQVCSSQGETWKNTSKYEFIDANTLKSIEDKKTTMYRKCP